MSERIRAADVISGMFDTLYGKVNGVVGMVLASAPWWAQHLPQIAQISAFFGALILWGLNFYLGLLRIRKEQAEINRLERGD